MRRSALYVPADRPDRITKVWSGSGGSAPDVVIADLEDGVAASARPAARSALAALLDQRPSATVPLYVRLGGVAALEADLEVLAGRHVDGWYWPKAEPASLELLDRALTAAGRTEPVVALVESAAGVLAAAELAAHHRVERLGLGEADLVADLGVDPGPDGEELLVARSTVVLAAAAAGIEGPSGPASTDFHDLMALERSSGTLRRLGFTGRSCIHPAQVAVVNRAFAPTEAAIAAARELVAAFDAAVAAGEGVVVGPDGRMVDEAVARRARRLLG